MTRTVLCKNQLLGKGMPRVCVPVQGQTQSSILKQVDGVCESKADIIEWRMDSFDLVDDFHATESVLEKIREHAGERLILATFRTAAEGGVRDIETDAYEDLIRYLFRNRSADILDVEWKNHPGLIQELTSDSGDRPKILASYHNFNTTETSENVREVFDGMQQCGADILKIAMMPQSEEDVLRTMEMALERKQTSDTQPYILLSMGDIGKVTRLAGELMGTCMTFGCVTEKSAPGQMDAAFVHDVLRELRMSRGGQIFFTGFMGTGKSTVAALLAKRLNLELMDTDERIEEQEGKAITELFATKGEAYFRDAESKLLIQLADEQPMIVSCGGGIILREDNVKHMKDCGIVVCLSASPETVYSRVCGDETRPMLNSDMSIDHIRSLMKLRQKRYDTAADVMVDTDGLSPMEVCNQILVEIKKIVEK